MPRTHRIALVALREGPGLAIPVAWALALRLWVRGALDLRGLPGPGGAKMVYALATGHTGRDWGTWVVAALQPVLGADAGVASQRAMLLGGLAAVLGASLAARALATRTAGLAAGLLAATWGQALFISVVLGNDAIAWGLAWLGVGLAWISGRAGLWGGTLAGAALALLGGAVKVVALPAAALIIVAPLLVRGRRPWLRALVVSAELGGAGWLARHSFLAGHATGQVQGLPAPSQVLQGLETLRQLAGTNPEGLVMSAVVGVALVGALVPSRRGWGARLVVTLLAALTLGLAAAAVGPKLRPRHLVVPALPVVVLAGVAAGRLLAWRRLGLLTSVALGLAMLWPIGQDALAFLNAWAGMRTTHEAARPSTLPRVARGWQDWYRPLKGLIYSDNSAVGAIDLDTLTRQGPPAGVAGVPLRDNREFHLRAAAALSGLPDLILEARWCCPEGEPTAACAHATVEALDAAGARLILPRNSQGTQRVGMAHQRWVSLLSQAAQPLEKPSQWWAVRDGEGAGGPLPCQRPGRRRGR